YLFFFPSYAYMNDVYEAFMLEAGDAHLHAQTGAQTHLYKQTIMLLLGRDSRAVGSHAAPGHDSRAAGSHAASGRDSRAAGSHAPSWTR
ncbi:hypothetical protein, partial [Paenibacillus agricola]